MRGGDEPPRLAFGVDRHFGDPLPEPKVKLRKAVTRFLTA
jgi:hypothetical protein